MLKTLVAAGVLGLTGLAGLRRRMITRNVTVLMYHDLCPDDALVDAWAVIRRSDFLKQIRHLRRHYEIVSLDEAEQAQRAGLRRPLAVVTFDDGLAGNHDVLLPIVEAERLPVTIYVATRHIEHGESYWFDRIVNAVNRRAPVALDLRAFGLGVRRFNQRRGARNWRSIQAMLTQLKTLSAEDQLAAAAAVEEQTRELRDRDAWQLRPMSIEALRRVASSQYVTVGAHTHGHQMLTRVSVEEARESIEHSRALLRAWTGQPIQHFAYPSGAYDNRVMQLVEQLGFKTAMTTDSGLWSPRASQFAIPRIAVGRYDDPAVFGVNLLGGLRHFMRFAPS